MNPKPITSTLSVGGQITTADVKALADRGVRSGMRSATAWGLSQAAIRGRA